MRNEARPDEYIVVVTSSGGYSPVWSWEIQRRPKPLGVILSGADFKTESAAKLAGEKALVALLKRLADEDGHTA
jgi:hypothetical protein